MTSSDDPFLSSVIARAAVYRLMAVGAMIACLWLAILWAVWLP
ncbi:MAG TPA: hypothetical protein VIB38_02305 [Aestuariivirgaceae bacterium]|jgi:hypothetical protein